MPGISMRRDSLETLSIDGRVRLTTPLQTAVAPRTSIRPLCQTMESTVAQHRRRAYACPPTWK